MNPHGVEVIADRAEFLVPRADSCRVLRGVCARVCVGGFQPAASGWSCRSQPVRVCSPRDRRFSTGVYRRLDLSACVRVCRCSFAGHRPLKGSPRRAAASPRSQGRPRNNSGNCHYRMIRLKTRRKLKFCKMFISLLKAENISARS